MSRQYIIENGAENNRWLYKIDHDGKGIYSTETNCYRPDMTEALVFTNRTKAVAIAKRARGRVWRLKQGMPETLIWPEDAMQRATDEV